MAAALSAVTSANHAAMYGSHSNVEARPGKVTGTTASAGYTQAVSSTGHTPLRSPSHAQYW